ncbi:MAG: hypothetical protein M3346_09315 [Actinomycetota bacterium]|nr:hypothetical protein [Actinomycetota bacterium]
MSGRDGTGEGFDFLRWTFGAGLAAIALLGLLILVGLIAVVVQPPEWMQFALGVMLAVGSASFAGLVAQALRPKDRVEGGSPYLAREQSGDDRQRKRRTA